MLRWFKKGAPPPPRTGPDFSAVDSRDKGVELARAGELEKMFLLPPEFGGEDVPPNWVLVPAWVVAQKADIDNNVIRPLAAEGKVSSYRAAPSYQGNSFVPNAVTIEASNPGSFSVTIAIWGDALTENQSK